MKTRTLFIFVALALVAPAVNATTISFNSLDYTGVKEFHVYYVDANGTHDNGTIKTNETLDVDASLNYILVIRPEKLDVINNTDNFKDFLIRLTETLFVVMFFSLLFYYGIWKAFKGGKGG